MKNPILHAIIEIDGTVVLRAHISAAEPMRSTYLTLSLETAEEAEEAILCFPKKVKYFIKM